MKPMPDAAAKTRRSAASRAAEGAANKGAMSIEGMWSFGMASS